MLFRSLQDGEFVARVEGDEFAVVLRESDRSVIARRAKRLLEAVAQPVELQNGEARVDVSIGIVVLPEDAVSAQDASRNADLALRKAKADGRSRAAFFDDEMKRIAITRRQLAQRLRKAIDNDELTVHFQPQVLGEGAGLFGVEALARWPDGLHGFIPPTEFVPVAESYGMIFDLGNWVLNEACRIGRQWLEAGIDVPHISVNVSAMQLWQPDFVQTVDAALRRYNLPASKLCIEVTESLFVDHEETRVLDVLTRLRDLGVLLSLDDFGSGYSSLGYLNKLPLRQIKIDRGFVAGVHENENKQKILRGIVALIKGLGLQVVAEGAELREEVSFLHELECDAVQGYFYGRPVSALQIPVEIARIKDARAAEVKRKADIAYIRRAG